MIRSADIPVRPSCGLQTITLIALTCLGLLLHAAAAGAQGRGHPYVPAAATGTSEVRTFDSAEEAVRALHAATRTSDLRALADILGAGADAVSSEDPAVDQRERARFVRKYEEMHRLGPDSDGGAVLLYVGAENWIFPFPVVVQNGRWQFDSRAGMQELLARRVGENELAAIEACRGLLATRDVHVTPRRPHIASDSAPLGYVFRRIPQAADSGVGDDTEGRISATVDLSTTVIAYPAQYRVTGVMTFVAGPDGAIYEQDLGSDTASAARTMTRVDLRQGWQPIERF
jgi:hypothetical protein